MTARAPFAVAPETIELRRAQRSSTGEPLGWVASILDAALRVDWIVLPPGERVAPEHAHSARDEIFVVIAGRVTPVVEGADQPELGAHALFVVPHGGPTTTIRNAGPDPATLLQVSAAHGDDRVRHAR